MEESRVYPAWQWNCVTTSEFTYTEYGNNAQRMLYDRKKDPSENENVAEAEDYKETANQLSKLLSDGRE